MLRVTAASGWQAADGEEKEQMMQWSSIAQALASREALLATLHAEDTDAYRLFHGATEGIPGLTVDRYGPHILVQTFRAPLEREEFEQLGQRLEDALPFSFWLVYNHRKGSKREAFAPWATPPAQALEAATFRELGLSYLSKMRHKGLDPLLFLDLRVVRRTLKAESEGKSVLNLFAYTCGAGVCALAGGATEVFNVDFAHSHLEVGGQNAGLNHLPAGPFRLIEQDVIPVLRQFAGLPIKGRARRRRYERFARRQFDVVLLDPPTWSKSPFGAVDIVRDYQSLFKPALLATAPGGCLIATNHAASVSRDDWHALLQRCADKSGRPLKSVDFLMPEADFPSFDQNPPLKIACCRV